VPGNLVEGGDEFGRPSGRDDPVWACWRGVIALVDFDLHGRLDPRTKGQVRIGPQAWSEQPMRRSRVECTCAANGAGWQDDAAGVQADVVDCDV
jgi:hypothetical protein